MCVVVASSRRRVRTCDWHTLIRTYHTILGPNLNDVSSETTAQIDALTRVDQQLFVTALGCFFQRIKVRDVL